MGQYDNEENETLKEADECKREKDRHTQGNRQKDRQMQGNRGNDRHKQGNKEKTD